jgi:translocation and assembly module TamB
MRRTLARVLRWLGIALLILLLLIVAVAGLADTDFGHRIIANRIAGLGIKSGLKVGIGRIEGSIYGKAEIVELRLSDPQGVFLSSPRVALDWQPLDWLDNVLTVKTFSAARVNLLRLPKFKPRTAGGSSLPAFDVDIGSFAIDQLMIAKGVAGPAMAGRANGALHLRKGIADLALDLSAREGDRAVVRLKAEPDKNLFDADAQVKSPSGGFVGALMGTRRAIDLVVNGAGTWQSWKGRGDARLDGKRVADLSVTNTNGSFGIKGVVMPAPFLAGKLQRLAAPQVAVESELTLKDRVIDGRLSAATPALFITADGAINLATNSFQALTVDTRLIQPRALFANMTGQTVNLKSRLSGPFAATRFEYLLTASRLAFDQTVIDGLRASGAGRWSNWPVQLPIAASARRITGIGDFAGGLMTNINVKGVLRATPRSISGEGLYLRSDKLAGKLGLTVDLTTGRYDVGLSGQLARYEIPGLGLVDVQSNLKATPGNGGRGFRLGGTGRAFVRRLDNAFLAGLAGGLPVLDTAFERGPDGVLYLRGFRLNAPMIALSGNGTRLADGRFDIDAKGNHTVYGPLKMALKGLIERPQIDLLLASPNNAMGLAAVRLDLMPSARGFDFVTAGQSTAGPFTARGQILLPPGTRAIIDVADSNLSGVRGVGRLVPITGGIDGELAIDGSGVKGILQFDMLRGLQHIRTNVTARGARLAGPPLIAATRADFDGDIILDPRGTTIDGTLTGDDLQYGAIMVERVAGNVRMKGGVGELRGAIAGTRGQQFDLQTVARFTPNRIEIMSSGTLDRRPLRLVSPAVLMREAKGWRLVPTALEFAGGKAQIGGLLAPNNAALEGSVTAMPMAILDMARPGLGLGGLGSGTFSYRLAGAEQPEGRLDLTVRGLSRAGLVLASTPIDLGVSAVLSGGKGGARLVAVTDGKTVGRAQIQLSNMPRQGTIFDRLLDASLFGQLRYSGPSDTLWKLSGVENFDLSGAVSVAADMGGRLSAPDIRGVVKTVNARIESTASGLVLTNVDARGQFDGSRLVIESLSGKSGKDGRVTGTGIVEFASDVRGIDVTLQADRAPLIDRDDIAATVTGPIRIKSDGVSGVISGDVKMDRSFFRLGQASAAQVPKLNVREISARSVDRPQRIASKPWRLDFRARAPNRLMVTGLGIDSEWQADLQIEGTIDSPSITGTADLVRGGYEFAGKRFELERGNIRFQGTSPPDPVLDILAVGDTQGINATIRVTGTGQRPEISFASVPALPQDEVLSRLLFGTSITNLSAPEAVQLAAAVSALSNGGNGINPINELRRAVGLDRLRILPADTATGQGTSIAAGKYLSRRTYVEIVTDGQGYTATRAEFQITRWLSILSTISTIGTQSVRVRISKDY